MIINYLKNFKSFFNIIIYLIISKISKKLENLKLFIKLITFL